MIIEKIGNGLIIVALSTVIFIGCDNPFLNKYGRIPASVVQTSNENATAQYGTLVLKLTPKMRSRTIIPTLSISSYLISFSNGPATKDPVSTTETTPSIELAVGTWDITVEGKDGSNNTIATYTETGVVINAGATTNVTAELQPLATGTGTIDITVNWPVTETVDTVEVTMDGTPVDAGTLTTTATSVQYIESKSPGSYLFVCRLKEGSVQKVAVMEIVQVCGNLTSSAIIDLTTDHFTAAPSAPTGLTVTEGAGQLELFWVDSSPVETGFVIERSPNDNSNFTVLDGSIAANTVAYTDTSAVDGTTYFYRIKATNDFGESGYSSEASGTYDVPVITGLSDDTTPTQSKTWTWDSDDINAEYRYLIDTTSGDPVDWSGSTWSTGKTASQTTGTATYYLHVQARDQAGNLSQIVNVNAILDNTAPDPPTVSGTTPTNDTTPTWTWNIPSDTGSSVVDIRYQLDSEVGTWTVVGGTTTTSYTPASALSLGSHTLFVQAQDSVGLWSSSGSSTIEIEDNMDFIGSFEVTDCTSNSTTGIPWNAPTNGRIVIILENPDGSRDGNFTINMPSDSSRNRYVIIPTYYRPNIKNIGPGDSGAISYSVAHIESFTGSMTITVEYSAGYGMDNTGTDTISLYYDDTPLDLANTTELVTLTPPINAYAETAEFTVSGPAEVIYDMTQVGTFGGGDFCINVDGFGRFRSSTKVNSQTPIVPHKAALQLLEDRIYVVKLVHIDTNYSDNSGTRSATLYSR